MIRHDEVDAQVTGVPGGIGAPDAAVHGDDQVNALAVQPIDRSRLKSVAVLQAFT
jgi:hypothetical protein